MARQTVAQMRKIEYTKQRRRVQALMRRWKKKGLVFDTNPLPDIPKTIKQESINRLRKITAKTLEEKAHKISEVTGKVINAREAKIESAREAGKARSVTGKVKAHLNKYGYDYSVTILAAAKAAKEMPPKVGEKFYNEVRKKISEEIETGERVEQAFNKSEAKRLGVEYPEGKTNEEVTDYLNQQRALKGEQQDRWITLNENEEINELTGEIRERKNKIINKRRSQHYDIIEEYESAEDYDSLENAPTDIDWAEQKLDALLNRLEPLVKDVAKEIINKAKSGFNNVNDYYAYIANNIDEVEQVIDEAGHYKYATGAIKSALTTVLSGGRALTPYENMSINDAIADSDTDDYDY